MPDRTRYLIFVFVKDPLNPDYVKKLPSQLFYEIKGEIVTRMIVYSLSGEVERTYLADDAPPGFSIADDPFPSLEQAQADAGDGGLYIEIGKGLFEGAWTATEGAMTIVDRPYQG